MEPCLLLYSNTHNSFLFIHFIQLIGFQRLCWPGGLVIFSGNGREKENELRRHQGMVLEVRTPEDSS